MAKKNIRLTRREFVKEFAATVAAFSASCATVPLRKPGSDDDEETTFDYIVVGSGAGGGPVAANLARAGYRVLILEAGGQAPNRNYTVPVFHPASSEDPDLSWSFFVNHYSNPSRQALDSKYQQGKGILYPRGATLGGSTAHNAMICLYPDNSDWNNLVSVTGDSNWAPENMRTYFQRVEAASYRKTRNPESKHGFSGWLNLEQAQLGTLLVDKKLITIMASAAEYASGGGRRFADFGQEVAQLFSEGLDPNDWNYVLNKTDGIFILPKATSDGKRNGTREHILDTQYKTGKITIRTGRLVTNLRFSPFDDKKVVGVDYLVGDHLYGADKNFDSTRSSSALKKSAFASKEVILSGGAFNTPQLLMLSGIGPQEITNHGIDLRHELRGVGKNLQDRYEVTVTTQLEDDLALLKDCTFGEGNDPCLDAYERDPSNHAYGTNGVCVALIRRSSMDKPDPDLVIFGVPGQFRGYVPGYAKSAQKKDHFTWAILKGHTKNTGGQVKLKSKDAWVTPDINFKYFDEGTDRTGEDLEAVLSGVKMARGINHHLIDRIITKLEDTPGQALQTDDQLRDHIRREAWGHHASCTCKIGNPQDPDAVLDKNFRVIGIKNLRVVDASVFPRIPGLFIVAPTYMIAEKASDDILADANKI